MFLSRRQLFRREIQRCLSTSTVVSNSYGLNDDQLMLQSMADTFAENEFSPFAEKWDREKIFPVEQLRKAASLGFGGVFVKEDYGGSGLGRVDGSVIFESLAQGCTSTTAYLTIHNMCAWMMDTYGNVEQKEKYLPGMCNLDLFSSYCLTESGSGSDAASLSTRAVLSDDGSHYILNGSKAFISGGSHSDVYLVMTRTGGSTAKGISCMIVEKDTPGLSFGSQEQKMGWNSQPTCQVIFEDCKIPVENLLGEEGMGFKIAMSGLDGGRLSIGTCSIGGAKRCFDIAREYVTVREQFGNPLSEYQNIQFKLADMCMELHAGRMMIRNAAKMMDEKDPNATPFCAMAKRFSTNAGFKIANDSLQTLGGYGYLSGYQIERIVRDLRVHQILEGTNEVMQMIISRSILSADP